MVNHTEQIEKSTKDIAKLEKELVVEEQQLEVIDESVRGNAYVTVMDDCLLIRPR